uniref:Uncharacterized protein n=1 Tax=Cannabis sativa TaxID=3483 RepID=A0A803QVW2_CANSA
MVKLASEIGWRPVHGTVQCSAIYQFLVSSIVLISIINIYVYLLYVYTRVYINTRISTVNFSGLEDHGVRKGLDTYIQHQFN